MKTRISLLFTFTAIVAFMILVFQSCKKDENKTNQPPTCIITSPTNGQQLGRGETVTITVDADDSDGNITEVRFFINDIGKSTTTSSPYKYIWNTSDEDLGNYTLRATSLDNKGDSKTDEISVGLINTPPTAIFTVSPTSGTTNTNFVFDASGCTDNATPTNQLQVRWDFDGNGSWDTNWNTNKTQNHQYSNEGTYSAKLEVKDTENITSQYIINIIVADNNTPPTAIFTVFPATGNTSTNFAFDANGCSDNETPTNLLQVRWDFDGNGSWDTGWSINKIQNHQYNNEGTYAAKLEVKDAGNLTSQYTINVIVTNVNTAPTAIFTVSPANGTTSTNFAFDANGCSDNETPSNLLQVRWDFDGNGSWDTNWDTNKTQNHQYVDVGTYIATLEVKDTEGLSNQSLINVIVINGYIPPIAVFSVSPAAGTISTNFTLNASGSSDNETPTNQLQVRWDFDGNGSWDTDWSINKIQNHQFGSVGSYATKLEVMDTDGLISDTTMVINVLDITFANFTDPRDGQTYVTVNIANQTWFAENLNFNTTNSWTYNNDPANGDIYGRLYNWDAARTACPSGWHLPSDNEWKQLEMTLGMSESQANIQTGQRGADQGTQLKSTTGWNYNGNGTNSSGFNALPGGETGYDGTGFSDLGIHGNWWTATAKLGTSAWYRILIYQSPGVGRDAPVRTHGFSVRCLKD